MDLGLFLWSWLSFGMSRIGLLFACGYGRYEFREKESEGRRREKREETNGEEKGEKLTWLTVSRIKLVLWTKLVWFEMCWTWLALSQTSGYVYGIFP